MPTSSIITDWLNPARVQSIIKAKFVKWHENHLFHLHLGQLSMALMASPVLAVYVPVVRLHLDDDSRYISVSKLFDTEPSFLDECTYCPTKLDLTALTKFTVTNQRPSDNEAWTSYRIRHIETFGYSSVEIGRQVRTQFPDRLRPTVRYQLQLRPRARTSSATSAFGQPFG